jgi:hypothetical protein
VTLFGELVQAGGDAGCPFVNEVRQRLLWYRSRGPGLYVVGAEPGFDPQRPRLVPAFTACVDLAAGSRAGKSACELPDVNVHSSGIGGTRLRQRGGVHREHGQRWHGARLPAPGVFPVNRGARRFLGE